MTAKDAFSLTPAEWDRVEEKYEAYLIGHRETIRRASTPSAAILAAYIEAVRAMR